MNYEFFLNHIKSINKKYEEIEKLTGENFNILSASHIGHRETVHTQLLSELFSPNGSHNQKDKFLKIFLNILGIKEKIKNPICQSEYVIDKKRRIDVVIKDEDFIIAIEAKIFAKDKDAQLKDYFEYLKRKQKNSKYLYYLTLDGHMPTKKSLKDKEVRKHIRLISFKNEIYEWINECIKEVSDIPILREGLYQYKLLLEKLTNKHKKKEREMKEIIGKDIDSIKAADEIVNNYANTWYEKEVDFWVELFNYAQENYFNDWEDGDQDMYQIWYDENGNEFNEEKILKNINYKYRGICFKKKLKGKEIYIGVEYRRNNICYLWYNGIEKEIENFEKEEYDNIIFYVKPSSIKLRFYPNSALSFEIFDYNEFIKKKKELAKELNELKKELLG